MKEEREREREKSHSSSFLCNLQGGETSSWSDFMAVEHIKRKGLNIASNRPVLPTPTKLSTYTGDADLLVL